MPPHCGGLAYAKTLIKKKLEFAKMMMKTGSSLFQSVATYSQFNHVYIWEVLNYH